MGEKIIKLIDKYKDYLRIGRIFGNYKAKIYFLDSFFKVDRVSTFSSFCGRVYNNLHNLTSPYSLSDIFEALTGGKGVKVAFAEWGGIVFGALCNFLGNLDEQKESGGIMSTARVIAETISETVIEVTLELAGAAVVGAVAAAAGVAISPTLILLGGVVLGQGVNTVVGILNDGETFTEWFSDLILDFPEKIGNAIWGNDDSIVVWEIEL